MVGVGVLLGWILECHFLSGLPQATPARRYGGIPVWLGDFGCKGDHLGFCSLSQATYGREGDGIYVRLSS